MLRLIIVLLIGCFSNVLYAQKAIFSTENVRLKELLDSGGKVPERINQIEWIIDGRKLRFGSKPIEVTPNPNQLDTILFRANGKSIYDTILCNIAQPVEYRFYYNDCCGDFKVRNMSLDRVLGSKVTFGLSTAKQDMKFLGSIGRTGILVDSTVQETITDECRSAMASNIYTITFSEIKNCADDSDCANELCLVSSGSKEMIWGFGYHIIDEKTSFRYMPLDQDSLIVRYDPSTGKIKVE